MCELALQDEDHFTVINTGGSKLVWWHIIPKMRTGQIDDRLKSRQPKGFKVVCFWCPTVGRMVGKLLEGFQRGWIGQEPRKNPLEFHDSPGIQILRDCLALAKVFTLAAPIPVICWHSIALFHQKALIRCPSACNCKQVQMFSSAVHVCFLQLHGSTLGHRRPVLQRELNLARLSWGGGAVTGKSVWTKLDYVTRSSAVQRWWIRRWLVLTRSELSCSHACSHASPVQEEFLGIFFFRMLISRYEKLKTNFSNVTTKKKPIPSCVSVSALLSFVMRYGH